MAMSVKELGDYVHWMNKAADWEVYKELIQLASATGIGAKRYASDEFADDCTKLSLLAIELERKAAMTPRPDNTPEEDRKENDEDEDAESEEGDGDPDEGDGQDGEADGEGDSGDDDDGKGGEGDKGEGEPSDDEGKGGKGKPTDKDGKGKAGGQSSKGEKNDGKQKPATRGEFVKNFEAKGNPGGGEKGTDNKGFQESEISKQALLKELDRIDKINKAAVRATEVEPDFDDEDEWEEPEEKTPPPPPEPQEHSEEWTTKGTKRRFVLEG